MSKFDQFDEENYSKDKDPEFTEVINRLISRRKFLKTSTVGGLSTWVLSSTAVGVDFLKGMGRDGKLLAEKITFHPISAGTGDTIIVPEGYDWETLVSWGDPLFSKGVSFNQKTRGDAKSQNLAFGDNNDGMSLFPLSDNHAILAVNNEYINPEWLHPSGKITNHDDYEKEIAAFGVSIFEIKKINNRWKVVKDGKYNRRITVKTPMEIVGPARGHELLKTSQDPTGTRSLGTWNNCANGQTPWGTYLTCEENFNGYFGTDTRGFKSTSEQRRYGIGSKSYSTWYRYDSRFDLNQEPNEPHRAGYVVEIDPFDPNSTPRKLTALGRFKHENAEVVVAKNGHVVVYLGDDERGDYIYRFVSKNKYRQGNKKHNMMLLEEGTLYVAKFNEQTNESEGIAGEGRWIPLVHGQNGLTAENDFFDQAMISIFTRKAADLVGATTMDRPEWIAVNPINAEVYCCLTNNKNRGKKKNAGGIEQLVNGPNPRNANHYGQIVRWQPDHNDHTADKFRWDLFVMAGNPLKKTGLYAGSKNINSENMFNSPDGIKFDDEGRLWIQTDGKYSNEGDFEGMGNNQMLVANTQTGEIKRFLTGPVACEMTGITWSPDKKTMFVGVQHPGEEKQNSHFPDGGNSIPRSSIIAIWKKDGGDIGS